MVKAALSGSVALCEQVQERLGPNRLPLLIAIDGADGMRFLKWIVEVLEQPFLLALQG